MKSSMEKVTDALYWLLDRQESQPSLGELAAHMQMSPAHAQKLFQQLVGLSPKQFLAVLTRERALERLRNGATVLDAALSSGLSGPGRLHDLLIRTDAMTPGEARRAGAGVQLQYGEGQTPFGPALLAWGERGISFLAFLNSDSTEHALAALQAQWPDARLTAAKQLAGQKLDAIFEPSRDQPLDLWLRGSPFQLQVWQALLVIPAGQHVSYGDLARHLDKPRASRAVGTAVGRNPIAWLIPCHRVITSSGALGGYRWGLETKQLMIGLEAAASHPPAWRRPRPGQAR